MTPESRKTDSGQVVAGLSSGLAACRGDFNSVEWETGNPLLASRVHGELVFKNNCAIRDSFLIHHIYAARFRSERSQRVHSDFGRPAGEQPVRITAVGAISRGEEL